MFNGAKKLQEWYPEYTLDDIRKAALKLPKKHQALIYKMYGENLLEYHIVSESEYSSFYSNVKNILKKILEGKMVRCKYDSFFDIFTPYSKEEVLKAFDKLNNKEKELLYKKFGKFLDERNKVTNSETTAIYRIKKKIFFILSGKKKNSDAIKKVFPDNSVEEILLAIKKLPKRQQDSILKRYGANLDELHKFESKTEENDFRASILNVKRVLNGEKIRFKTQSIFDWFPEYSKEDLFKVISMLSLKEQDVIFKRFGKNLDECNPVLHSETAYFGIVIKPHMEAILLNKVSDYNRSISRIFKNFSKEDIKQVVILLPKEYQKIIYQKYGNNLNEVHVLSNKTDREILYNRILPFMKKKLEVESVKKIISLMDCFKDYSKEEIQREIRNLSSKSQNYLYQRYGQNLDEINIVSDIVLHKLYKIISILKMTLKKKSLYEKLKLDKDLVDARINKLSDTEKEALYMRFGYDLDHPVDLPLSDEFINYVDSEIIPKLRSGLFYDINDVLEIINNLNKYFNISKINKDELIIFILNFKLLNSTNSGYSVKEIAEYFNITGSDVYNITNKVLNELGINMDDAKRIIFKTNSYYLKPLNFKKENL